VPIKLHGLASQPLAKRCTNPQFGLGNLNPKRSAIARTRLVRGSASRALVKKKCNLLGADRLFRFGAARPLNGEARNPPLSFLRRLSILSICLRLSLPYRGNDSGETASGTCGLRLPPDSTHGTLFERGSGNLGGRGLMKEPKKAPERPKAGRDRGRHLRFRDLGKGGHSVAGAAKVQGKEGLSE
jgi:hypothetical protein